MQKLKTIGFLLVVLVIITILATSCNQQNQRQSSKPGTGTIASRSTNSSQPIKSAFTATHTVLMKTQVTVTKLGSVNIASVRCPDGKVVNDKTSVDTEKENIAVGPIGQEQDANIISSLPNATYRINLKGRTGKTGEVSFVWTAADGTQPPPLEIKILFDRKGMGWIDVTLNLTKPDRNGKPFRLAVSGDKKEVQ